MKTIKIVVLALLGVVFALTVSQAQDYKHPKGLINKDGKVFSPEGEHMGWITKDGIIKDTAGVKIAHIDAEGSLVDAKTGKKQGKMEKNGNYVLYPTKTPDEKWSVSPPMNGVCEVKNSKGETIVEVHENYKQQGACAYHCLSMQKQGKKMKMK